jgi:hypothetical protein
MPNRFDNLQKVVKSFFWGENPRFENKFAARNSPPQYFVVLRLSQAISKISNVRFQDKQSHLKSEI